MFPIFCSICIASTVAVLDERANVKLTRHSYTESISLLYSQPTFLIDNHESLAAFTSKLLPERLDSIQNIQIYQDMQTLGERLINDELFIGSGSYKTLHDHKFTSCNAILPVLHIATWAENNIRHDHVWLQVLRLLRQLPSLRELKVQTIFRSSPEEERKCLATGEIPEKAAEFIHSVNYELWRPVATDMFQDFSMSTEMYAVGSYWYYVKTLQRNGATK